MIIIIIKVIIKNKHYFDLIIKVLMNFFLIIKVIIKIKQNFNFIMGFNEKGHLSQ